MKESKNKKHPTSPRLLDRFVSEAVARAKYHLFCLIMVDETWDMGADLVGGVFPWQGVWWDGQKYYKRYYELAA